MPCPYPPFPFMAGSIQRSRVEVKRDPEGGPKVRSRRDPRSGRPTFDLDRSPVERPSPGKERGLVGRRAGVRDHEVTEL